MKMASRSWKEPRKIAHSPYWYLAGAGTAGKKGSRPRPCPDVPILKGAKLSMAVSRACCITVALIGVLGEQRRVFQSPFFTSSTGVIHGLEEEEDSHLVTELLQTRSQAKRWDGS